MTKTEEAVREFEKFYLELHWMELRMSDVLKVDSGKIADYWLSLRQKERQEIREKIEEVLKEQWSINIKAFRMYLREKGVDLSTLDDTK